MAQNDGGSSGGSNPVDNLASRPKRKRITIHIQSQVGSVGIFLLGIPVQTDENRLAFKIMPNLKLSKMFHEYCQRKQYDLRTVRFFHEGRRLLGKYTAAKLNLEDQSQIDCMFHQTGGGL
ncbi:small ubiquitin-related modifier 1 [Gossypium hirsutum]|uniref:Small ubiquitin-related modifier 1 n=1 Tax=Gossypium hirsutum TaxID=3635 RepID=A0A1U8P870_GOSHI|nr:small ubiquitin-related modifier 1-like [Gossypium hirsutum]